MDNVYIENVVPLGIPRFDCHYRLSQSKRNQISNAEGTTKLNKDVAHFETYAKRKKQ